MEPVSGIIVNIFKAFLAIGIFSLLLAVISIIITYIFDLKNIREENSHLSTGIGNALLVLHSFFEPGRKPKTEQVVWIKKRRTPLEKRFSGFSEFQYDKRFIRGYKHIENKRYVLHKGKLN